MEWSWGGGGAGSTVAFRYLPVKGCEIQISAFGRSGATLCLQLVKSQEDDEKLQHDDELNHRTNILLDLLLAASMVQHRQGCLCRFLLCISSRSRGASSSWAEVYW